jgi:hypothetical protein
MTQHECVLVVKTAPAAFYLRAREPSAARDLAGRGGTAELDEHPVRQVPEL